MADIKELGKLAKLIRYYILRMTTRAGSGHPTSSLSATDLAVTLFFSQLRFDLKNPQNPNNNRVIFSKGHATPLLYSLYAAAGVLGEKDLLTYRQFGSDLEGHPTPKFKYVEVATGSLGQGLSVGLGMALAIRSGAEGGQAQGSSSENAARGQTSPRLEGRDTSGILPIVYVLMGDSEIAEGSVWEAVELASYYKLGNLVAIVDVNRLGQSGETMVGWNLDVYKARFEAFGWEAKVIDGHNFSQIIEALESVDGSSEKPIVILAKTIKGRGVSFLEDKESWHGKALSQEDFEKAIKELGRVDKTMIGEIRKPISNIKYKISNISGRQKAENRRLAMSYKIGEMVATRKAYGETLARLGEVDERIVSLDAEVKNSTFAEIFKEKYPERFFEMFIAEQNMVGVALGFSKRGKIPFVSTFAAFFTRAFDQIRMAAYSRPNIKFVGSHAGVSIGEDGASQMGLEDLAMFRAVFGSIVLCPADAVSCQRLVELAAQSDGLFYIRTNRPATPVIYKEASGESSLRSSSSITRTAGLKEGQDFKIGGSRVVRSSGNDKLTIVACGVTLFEALRAYDELGKVGIKVRVIDAYSIKPIDEETLKKAADEAGSQIITVEDHYSEGGLGDAVLNVFAAEGKVRIHKLAVSKLPMSGKGEELLDYEGINWRAIVKKVGKILG